VELGQGRVAGRKLAAREGEHPLIAAGGGLDGGNGGLAAKEDRCEHVREQDRSGERQHNQRLLGRVIVEQSLVAVGRKIKANGRLLGHAHLREGCCRGPPQTTASLEL